MGVYIDEIILKDGLKITNLNYVWSKDEKSVNIAVWSRNTMNWTSRDDVV